MGSSSDSMLTRTGFNKILQQQGTLIIDGGLATELENRGHDLLHPLWSGKILLEDPDAIKQVHLDYFLAGADIAITSSYQISEPGIKKHLGLNDDQTQHLLVQSVTVAKEARSLAYKNGVSNTRTLLIAGSIGPYGAYLADGSEYRGDYRIAGSEMKDFHRTRMRALVSEGVDLLALETIPNLGEITALLDLLAEDFPDAIAFLSCTMRDAVHLSDGSSLEDLVAAVAGSDQIVALGINCVSPDIVVPFLKATRVLTRLPLLCYPNSGEIYDGQTKSWSGIGDAKVDERGASWQNWQSSGASLIGGCCRTTPVDIKAMSAVLKPKCMS